MGPQASDLTLSSFHGRVIPTLLYLAQVSLLRVVAVWSTPCGSTCTIPRVPTRAGGPATGGGGRAGKESHQAPGSQEGQAHWGQTFLSGCPLRPAAAGHRAQGPCCPAPHSTTASADRGSGERRPGLRVRRSAPGEGQCLKCRGDRSPALTSLEMSFALLGKFIICIYLCFRFSSGISQPFSENSTFCPAPPVISLPAAAQGLGAWADVVEVGAQCLPQPRWWFTPLCVLNF